MKFFRQPLTDQDLLRGHQIGIMMNLSSILLLLRRKEICLEILVTILVYNKVFVIYRVLPSSDGSLGPYAVSPPMKT